MNLIRPPWLPGGVFWVILSGAGLVAAAVSIVTSIKVPLATVLLALLLLLIILLVHLPGMMADQENPVYMTKILKDSGLLGAALYMSGKSSK